tara:strand:- start:714 stop:890 length:177 start_codon:yes stop_codon:yes gene_type:complete
MPKKKKVVATMDTVTEKKVKNHRKLGDIENELIDYKNKKKKMNTTKVFETKGTKKSGY